MAKVSKKALELAQQQFIGYQHAKSGYDIESLAVAMGLSPAEWDALRDTVPLADQDKLALDLFFIKLKVKK